VLSAVRFGATDARSAGRTQADDARAQRLYESRGLGRSGREKRTTGSTP
jgi:hypothetical protein